MMVERGILLEEAIVEFEKIFIRRVMELCEGNQSRAAKALGIHRNTLSRKVEEYGLNSRGRRRGLRSSPERSFRILGSALLE